jgi:hypothetical protein
MVSRRAMKRLYPRQLNDKFLLSQLLERFLATLQHSALEVKMKALSYDSNIPEDILLRLQNLHRNPDDAVNIRAEDYHVVFSNLLFRYPTVRLWRQANGDVYIEL